MIQRIQTIYLLVAVAIMSLSATLPLAFISTTNGELFDLYALGLRDINGELIQSTIYLFVLALIAIITPLSTIFLYKRRMLQLRICVVELVLLIGFYVMVGAYYFLCHRALSQIGVEMQGLHPAIFAPIGAIVVVGLAARAIFNDEIAVRASDRFR